MEFRIEKKSEQRITCECGNMYRRDYMSKHIKTQIHETLMKFREGILQDRMDELFKRKYDEFKLKNSTIQ
jgi:AAA+ superfamily predicted ATPase